uniref:Dimer_Tnp_hAT domain-containing protein n=1 Tax=Caenorhabditis japonica TaxID=281687 RepID=A0A8R1I3L2_CAEJA
MIRILATQQPIIKLPPIPKMALTISLSSLNMEQNWSLDLQSKLVRYHALLTTNRPTFHNPLEFWRGNGRNFDRLSLIAAELFASPASVSVSERTFSRCSDFVRQKKTKQSKSRNTRTSDEQPDFSEDTDDSEEEDSVVLEDEDVSRIFPADEDSEEEYDEDVNEVSGKDGGETKM